MPWWIVIPGACVGLGEALRRPRRIGVAVGSGIGAAALAFGLHWFFGTVLGAGWPAVREAAEGPIAPVLISVLVVALGGLDLRRPTSA